MCGITGFWSRVATDAPFDVSLRRMAQAIQHRGPDASGEWIDVEAGIALGHRRLAIVDISPTGAQPMTSSTGRFVMAFNGEVYNFESLRQELASHGAEFRGKSDTEVMLAAFEFWGIRSSVERFVGMFAFALWDRQERLFYLCRDRLGEKPLYYGWIGHAFAFGSELKSLKAHTGWEAEIDRDAISLFLRYGYVPGPYSIYKGISKLPPGTLLTIDASAIDTQASPEPVPYWSARQIAEDGLKTPWQGNPKDAVDDLEKLLRESIRQQMIADVPLGAFLSGGIDSSTVVALMQAQSMRPIKTFSIGFHEKAFDEAVYAREVAKHLGTDHTELYVSPNEAMAVIPRLPDLYDEPFADSSQIPTFLVAELARRHVTVSLSGDAGDELFAGYSRYAVADLLRRRIAWLPLPARRAIAQFAREAPASTIELIFGWAERGLPKFGRGTFIEKVRKSSELIEAESPAAMYRQFVSQWRNPDAVTINSIEPASDFFDPASLPETADFIHQMMYIDLVTYLPDDILVKVDRAAMGVSLEARIPLLDHRIVEFAWRLPLDIKVRNGITKWPLRQLLYRYVPPTLLERPKMGFGIPIGEWLRGPLREWAEDLLSERRLRDEGYFNPEPIRTMWREHNDGVRNWQGHLWSILMFQAWLATQNAPIARR